MFTVDSKVATSTPQLLSTNELSVCLVTDAADGSAALLERRPSFVVGLRLMKVHGLLVFIHFVEPKFVGVALISQDVCIEFCVLECLGRARQR